MNIVKMKQLINCLVHQKTLSTRKLDQICLKYNHRVVVAVAGLIYPLGTVATVLRTRGPLGAQKLVLIFSSSGKNAYNPAWIISVFTP